VSVEQVRARRVSDDGETVLTTTHGNQYVRGGYVVLRSDGEQFHMPSEKFEALYRVKEVEAVSVPVQSSLAERLATHGESDE